MRRSPSSEKQDEIVTVGRGIDADEMSNLSDDTCFFRYLAFQSRDWIFAGFNSAPRHSPFESAIIMSDAKNAPFIVEYCSKNTDCWHRGSR